MFLCIGYLRRYMWILNLLNLVLHLIGISYLIVKNKIIYVCFGYCVLTRNLFHTLQPEKRYLFLNKFLRKYIKRNDLLTLLFMLKEFKLNY